MYLSKPFLAILICLLLFSCDQSKTNQADKVETTSIKIGFAGALSGPASFIGTEITRGATLAIDRINSSGGVNGRMIELVARDDEHQPTKTIALYKELVELEGVVGMLGATNSGSMLAVAPLINSTLKIPVICPATDATKITENQAQADYEDNYIFRVGMYGFGQANFMVDTAVQKLGFTKIGLLTWSGGWGVTGRGEIRRRLTELGLEPVADETYDGGDTDMTAQLLKLKKSGAEIILNYGLVKDNTFVVKTRQQLGDDTPYMSAWGIAGPAFWQAAGVAAEGVLVSTTITLDGPQSSERSEFVMRYQNMYGEKPIAPVFAVGAYDAIFLFRDAIVLSGGSDPSEIRNSLENITNFDGLVKKFDRPVFTARRHNSITEKDMLLTRWTAGELLEVKFDDVGPSIQLTPEEKIYLDPKTMNLLINK